jgi:hypothetical protein
MRKYNYFIKVLLAAFLLPAAAGCGLFRAEETPVIVVLATPTPEVGLVGPPQVEVEILPELFGGFATPTPDTAAAPPVFIVVPPTPTYTPWVIIVTATPEPPAPVLPTATPDVGVVLPVTGADLSAQPSPAIPFWSFGLIFAGILLVAFGIFRQRR